MVVSYSSNVRMVLAYFKMITLSGNPLAFHDRSWKIWTYCTFDFDFVHSSLSRRGVIAHPLVASSALNFLMRVDTCVDIPGICTYW